MLSSTKFMLIISNRNIYTTAVLCGQQGRFMKKVLHETDNRRKWFKEAGSAMPIQLHNNLAKGASEGKRSSNSKRVAVLNKLFMRHITDLMATGTSSSEFLGKGIEINRVKVTPDFKGVNVFWIAKGTENDDNIEHLLRSNAGELRHELSQLRVMGLVPKINFVKDKAYAKLVEVDITLSKADFGDDYIPVEPSFKLKSDFKLTTTLSSKLKENIESVDAENEDLDDCEEIPPMRMDVFGLDHGDILFRVQKGMKKSQAIHRTSNKSDVDSGLPKSVNEDPIEFSSRKEQKEEFAQFLHKRQIMQARAKRTREKYPLEKEYFRTEYYNERNSLPYNQEVKNDEDFYEEEEDIKKI